MARRSPRPAPPASLGRRERQILEVVYRLGRASVSGVRAELPDPPTYSAVRGMLNLLKDKGHLRHEVDGLRYVYLPVVSPVEARRSALASCAFHVSSSTLSGISAGACGAIAVTSVNSFIAKTPAISGTTGISVGKLSPLPAVCSITGPTDSASDAIGDTSRLGSST